MRRAVLVDLLIGCLPSVHRAGIKLEQTQAMVDKLSRLDGPGVSKHHKWLRALMGACIRETSIYRDLSPSAWANLKLVHPASPDLKALKKARTEIKNAWRSAVP